MGILEQAQAPQQPIQEAAQQPQPQAKQPQQVRIATTAGKILFDPAMQETVANKLMADGKIDEDEAGELAVNLIVGALDQIQKGGENSDQRAISLALPMVSLLVAEYASMIGALPQEQVQAFAKAVLPAAVAIFKMRVVDKQSAPEEQGAM